MKRVYYVTVVLDVVVTVAPDTRNFEAGHKMLGTEDRTVAGKRAAGILQPDTPGF